MSFHSSQEFESVYQELSLSRRFDMIDGNPRKAQILDLIDDIPLLSSRESGSLMVASDSQAMDYPPR